jgi:hypothetical protein
MVFLFAFPFRQCETPHKDFTITFRFWAEILSTKQA